MDFSLHAVEIADASLEDIAAIDTIYSYYVKNTLVSMEEIPPSLEELNNRRLHYQEVGLPYIVAKLNGSVIGFSYASPYRPRSGYRFTVENSVYISHDYQGKGLGAHLLNEIIRRCRAGGYCQMIAVISHIENSPSVKLHSKLGFKTVGILKAAGFKFNQWIDTILMQRSLDE